MLAGTLQLTAIMAIATSSSFVASLPLVEIPAPKVITASHSVRQSPLDLFKPYSGQHVSVIQGRALVDDTLRGLLGGLAIIPGTVQLSDLLLGDGKTSKGLLGSLGGLLLDVTPADATASGISTETESNSTAVDTAVGASYGYSLVASKKQTSRVYLMPVRQADVVVGDSSSNASTPDGGSSVGSTSHNDTMLVKMLVHAVQQDENPVMMCATYGASPPTDLDVAPCTAANDTSSSSTSNSDGAEVDPTTGQRQLFTYDRKTGDLTPMFDEVPASSPSPSAPIDGSDATSNANATLTDPATSDPSQDTTANAKPTTEMRMHFKAADVIEGSDPTSDTQDTKIPVPSSSVDQHDCEDEDDDDASDKVAEETPASEAAVRVTLGELGL